jgi:hypothetical protein
MTVGPVVAARHESGRAVVTGEVDQRDHRGELQLREWFGDVRPYALVAVEPLVLRAGPALQDLAQVELEASAVRTEHPFGETEEDAMAHDLDREGLRDPWHAWDVLREGTHEGLRHRVEHRAVRICGFDGIVDLVVDVSNDIGAEQPLHDHPTVALESHAELAEIVRSSEALESSGSGE